jgi:hypothetical protein
MPRKGCQKGMDGKIATDIVPIGLHRAFLGTHGDPKMSEISKSEKYRTLEQ